jgi:hypothetical protein
MTLEQRQSIRAMLGDVPLDAGGELDVQRPMFEEFLGKTPLPDDVRLKELKVGGVPILEIAVPGTAGAADPGSGAVSPLFADLSRNRPTADPIWIGRGSAGRCDPLGRRRCGGRRSRSPRGDSRRTACLPGVCGAP